MKPSCDVLLPEKFTGHFFLEKIKMIVIYQFAVKKYLAN
jgi:hypothetical protein